MNVAVAVDWDDIRGKGNIFFYIFFKREFLGWLEREEDAGSLRWWRWRKICYYIIFWLDFFLYRCWWCYSPLTPSHPIFAKNNLMFDMFSFLHNISRRQTYILRHAMDLHLFRLCGVSMFALTPLHSTPFLSHSFMFMHMIFFLFTTQLLLFFFLLASQFWWWWCWWGWGWWCGWRGCITLKRHKINDIQTPKE